MDQSGSNSLTRESHSKLWGENMVTRVSDYYVNTPGARQGRAFQGVHRLSVLHQTVVVSSFELADIALEILLLFQTLCLSTICNWWGGGDSTSRLGGASEHVLEAWLKTQVNDAAGGIGQGHLKSIIIKCSQHQTNYRIFQVSEYSNYYYRLSISETWSLVVLVGTGPVSQLCPACLFHR